MNIQSLDDNLTICKEQETLRVGMYMPSVVLMCLFVWPPQRVQLSVENRDIIDIVLHIACSTCGKNQDHNHARKMPVVDTPPSIPVRLRSVRSDSSGFRKFHPESGNSSSIPVLLTRVRWIPVDSDIINSESVPSKFLVNSWWILSKFQVNSK